MTDHSHYDIYIQAKTTTESSNMEVAQVFEQMPTTALEYTTGQSQLIRWPESD